MGEMKQGVDTAAEMVAHSQPLTYEPTVPVLGETFVDTSGYDAGLAQISNEERLRFLNSAVEGLETEEVALSGIFSNGTNTVAMTNTRSEHAQYFQTSDAQVVAVLAHSRLKWEVLAEQSAQARSDLDPASMRRELAFLVERYQNDKPQQLPLGSYDVVFGPAATAEMISLMNGYGFDGGLMKRGFSFLREGRSVRRSFRTSSR